MKYSYNSQNLGEKVSVDIRIDALQYNYLLLYYAVIKTNTLFLHIIWTSFTNSMLYKTNQITGI